MGTRFARLALLAMMAWASAGCGGSNDTADGGVATDVADAGAETGPNAVPPEDRDGDFSPEDAIVLVDDAGADDVTSVPAMDVPDDAMVAVTDGTVEDVPGNGMDDLPVVGSDVVRAMDAPAGMDAGRDAGTTAPDAGHDTGVTVHDAGPACPGAGIGHSPIWTCTADVTHRVRCVGGGLQTQACAYGCQQNPTGVDDVCRPAPPPGGHRLWLAWESPSSCLPTVEAFFHCLLERTNFNALAAGYHTGFAVSWGGSANVPASCGADYQCAVDHGHFPVGDLDVVLIIHPGRVGGTNAWDVSVNAGGRRVHIHGAQEGDVGGNCGLQTVYGMHELYEATSDPGSADCCDGEVSGVPSGASNPAACLVWNVACSRACAHWGPTGCAGDGSYGITRLDCGGGQTYLVQLVSPASDEYGGTCVPIRTVR